MDADCIGVKDKAAARAAAAAGGVFSQAELKGSAVIEGGVCSAAFGAYELGGQGGERRRETSRHFLKEKKNETMKAGETL